MTKHLTKPYVVRVMAAMGAAMTFSVLSVADDPQPQWFKGNLHTHSLWSDGDEFPEMIGDWYRNHGYHFLALTDHNTLSQGERWMKVEAAVKRSDADLLNRYRTRFGDRWVETRGEPGGDDHEVRLKPLAEFRHLLEQPQKFLLIQAEEVSDRAEGKPVHINATNISEVIQPAHGDTVRDTIQNNVRAILEHGLEHGLEVLPHVNHPNFGYAITAEELATVVAEQFFEVYNGHPAINHLGDEDHPSIERMWDVINVLRREELDAPLMLGIAVDDSHEYHGVPGSHPGRGWIMVRSHFLTPRHIIQAVKRGEFYASSGVNLDNIEYDSSAGQLSLEIIPRDGATYRTDFIASFARSSDAGDNDDRIGRIVATSRELNPRYQMSGEELYVRAVVTSDQPPADPSFEGQMRQAWVQPVAPSRAAESE